MSCAYTFFMYYLRMIEKYYFEFSKTYCRLMRLELLIKNKLISSLLAYYKEDIIGVFKRFFYNKDRLKRYNYSSGNAFLAILNNPQLKSSQKFKHLISKMYLSDLLVMILQCEQFQKTEITGNFYNNIPDKFSILISAKTNLLELRNGIAHYNFRDFEKNRSIYLESLKLFEIYIGRNIKGITELPKFEEKPSIRVILLSIKEIRPDLLEIDANKDDEMEYYYNKHRVLMDLCDDIAIFNGYDTSELPSPWTILRQMYYLKQEIKKEQSKDVSEIDIFSLPLFKNLK